MTKKPKPVSVQAYLETKGGDFVAIEKALQSPELQAQLTSQAKRQLARITKKLREAGKLYEVPYIGPRPKG